MQVRMKLEKPNKAIKSVLLTMECYQQWWIGVCSRPAGNSSLKPWTKADVGTLTGWHEDLNDSRDASASSKLKMINPLYQKWYLILGVDSQ